MNKRIKIILIIVAILVGIILLDTIQARLLKNSPFISWKEELEDDDSWVDRGILIDTYYCTKEKDIITVSWHFKNSKYTCPIDNINSNEDITMSIKDGTLTNEGATIIITDLTGKDNVYGEEYRIDKNENEIWKELDVVVEGNYGWNLIGYSVGEDNKLELEVNWKWLYGTLEEGEYRIVKSTSEMGSLVNNYFSVEFEIN